MSQTKAQRKKQQKKKAKEKRHRKERNIQHNSGPVRWRLDVLYQGSWKLGLREYKSWSAVERHKDETEKLREQGQEVIAGRVVNLTTGKIDLEIAPSPPKVKEKGALPDRLVDEPEAAKKGLLGIFSKK